MQPGPRALDLPRAFAELSATQASRQQLLEQYEARMAELLAALRQVRGGQLVWASLSLDYAELWSCL